jgi:hypothetical protein
MKNVSWVADKDIIVIAVGTKGVMAVSINFVITIWSIVTNGGYNKVFLSFALCKENDGYPKGRNVGSNVHERFMLRGESLYYGWKNKRFSI